ncbi:hypothetical protein EAI_05522 [Harpegnathos saltator]|uniref:Uncharacterized protein n=1 Tax=Harpegnathos saltator TaxID=610380 RepID=E2B4X2_HARSA|nr:hypothetical protein EAI_05522 [Harpegnathos saltator]
MDLSSRKSLRSSTFTEEVYALENPGSECVPIFHRLGSPANNTLLCEWEKSIMRTFIYSCNARIECSRDRTKYHGGIDDRNAARSRVHGILLREVYPLMRRVYGVLTTCNDEYNPASSTLNYPKTVIESVEDAAIDRLLRVAKSRLCAIDRGFSMTFNALNTDSIILVVSTALDDDRGDSANIELYNFEDVDSNDGESTTSDDGVSTASDDSVSTRTILWSFGRGVVLNDGVSTASDDSVSTRTILWSFGRDVVLNDGVSTASDDGVSTASDDSVSTRTILWSFGRGVVLNDGVSTASDDGVSTASDDGVSTALDGVNEDDLVTKSYANQVSSNARKASANNRARTASSSTRYTVRYGLSPLSSNRYRFQSFAKFRARVMVQTTLDSNNVNNAIMAARVICPLAVHYPGTTDFFDLVRNAASTTVHQRGLRDTEDYNRADDPREESHRSFVTEEGHYRNVLAVDALEYTEGSWSGGLTRRLCTCRKNARSNLGYLGFNDAYLERNLANDWNLYLLDDKGDKPYRTVYRVLDKAVRTRLLADAFRASFDTWLALYRAPARTIENRGVSTRDDEVADVIQQWTSASSTNRSTRNMPTL